MFVAQICETLFSMAFAWGKIVTDSAGNRYLDQPLGDMISNKHKITVLRIYTADGPVGILHYPMRQVPTKIALDDPPSLDSLNAKSKQDNLEISSTATISSQCDS